MSDFRLKDSPLVCPGGYVLHLYCKYENPDHAVDEFPREPEGCETRADALKMARGWGWLISKDRTATCPKCAKRVAAIRAANRARDWAYAAHNRRPHRGCTLEQYAQLRQMGKTGKSPIRAFLAQRKLAETRGIGWEMTLWEWWCIWRDSGHWHERGTGQGYVMCRNGDLGPYKAGNIYIAPAWQNTSDGNRKNLGFPVGVHRDKNPAHLFVRREVGGIIKTVRRIEKMQEAVRIREAMASPDFTHPTLVQRPVKKKNRPKEALFAPLLDKQTVEAKEKA